MSRGAPHPNPFPVGSPLARGEGTRPQRFLSLSPHAGEGRGEGHLFAIALSADWGTPRAKPGHDEDQLKHLIPSRQALRPPILTWDARQRAPHGLGVTRSGMFYRSCCDRRMLPVA
jgi:hypothetical protein